MPSLSDRVPIPPKESMNTNLSAAREDSMLRVFGRPGALTRDCSDPTGAFARRVIVRRIGAIRVRGYDIAVESLERVLTEANAEIPGLLDEIKTEGMLCVRHRRGNPSRYSNHSWGCAIDLYFGNDGVIDQGERAAHRGNFLLCPFFNRHGWYWGAEFSGSSVDSMHFELSEEAILKIGEDGQIGDFGGGGGGGSIGGGGGGGGGDTGTGPLRYPPFAANAELQAIALGERALLRGRDHGEATGLVQDGLDLILPSGERINAGVNRGTFGPLTETAVQSFQRRAGILPDGLVGKDTIRALDAALSGATPSPGPGPGPAPGPTPPPPVGQELEAITEIAARSEIARYRWKDRGEAPVAYIKGMALVFARCYCRLKNGDRFVTEMAKANSGNAARDALAIYNEVFASLGMSNASSGPDTLRHLFVLLTGLGMRESSGQHCEGRDQNARNITAETAEAGLFQTSYNARDAHPLLPELFDFYRSHPQSAFLSVFKKGVRCGPEDAENFGSGAGRDFQEMSKKIPEFATEFAAIGLRHTAPHWGPIKRMKAEVKPECDEMFRQVQAAVDNSNLCPFLG